MKLRSWMHDMHLDDLLAVVWEPADDFFRMWRVLLCTPWPIVKVPGWRHRKLVPFAARQPLFRDCVLFCACLLYVCMCQVLFLSLIIIIITITITCCSAASDFTALLAKDAACFSQYSLITITTSSEYWLRHAAGFIDFLRASQFWLPLCSVEQTYQYITYLYIPVNIYSRFIVYLF